MWTGHALMHSLFRMMSMSSRLARRNFPSWYFRCAASWFKPSSVFWLNLDVPIRSWDPDFPCPRNPFETPPALEVPPQRPEKDSSMSDETKEGANWLVVLWDLLCVVREVGKIHEDEGNGKEDLREPASPIGLLSCDTGGRSRTTRVCWRVFSTLGGFNLSWSPVVPSLSYFVMIMQDSQSVNQERSLMPNRNMRTSTWKVCSSRLRSAVTTWCHLISHLDPFGRCVAQHLSQSKHLELD